LEISASITSNPVLEEWTEADNEINMDAKQELVVTKALFMPWIILFTILWILLVWLILSGAKKKKKEK
jgi:hypothetical protein